MRRAVVLTISAGLLSAAFAMAAGSAIARPKVTLNQCASALERCLVVCPGYVDGVFPPSGNSLSDANCRNRCNDNHAACVDAAMSLQATTVKPPSRIPGENILQTQSSFGAATVAPTGAPRGAAPAPAAGGTVLR